MSFIVALFTDTCTELMSGAKSRKWVHHNSTNQPTYLQEILLAELVLFVQSFTT